jgi:hypothetical protein
MLGIIGETYFAVVINLIVLAKNMKPTIAI